MGTAPPRLHSPPASRVHLQNDLLYHLQKDEQAVIKIWRAQLHDFVHRVVGGFRIADIFDIVTSYPDSSEAVTDLQQCMAVCSLQARLVRVYRHACSTRLHIPGKSLLALPSLQACKLCAKVSDNQATLASLPKSECLAASYGTIS